MFGVCGMCVIPACHPVAAGKKAYEEPVVASRGVTHVFLISAVSRPVDACEEGTHSCDIQERALCTYTGGSSYSCSCLPGFSGDGRTCQGTQIKAQQPQKSPQPHPEVGQPQGGGMLLL